jgi:antitoxin component YwqK of YwqJK toxin-antitoxin module
MINNRKEGEYTEYYNNGQLMEICNFIHDKREGENKLYNDKNLSIIIMNIILLFMYYFI